MKWFALILVLIASFVAMAQQQPVDQRVSSQLIDALRAQIIYQQAVLDAMVQDNKKLAEWWVSYVQGLTPAMADKRE